MFTLDRPLNQSNRRRSGEFLYASDREPNVFALFGHAHLAIVKPPPPMAYDFMPLFDKGARQFRIHQHPTRHAQHADLHVEALEYAQKPPTADARPVFEDRFNKRAAFAFVGRKSNVGQHILGMLIAFENRMLAAGFDVQFDVDGDASAAWPARLGKLGAIATKIPRRAKLPSGALNTGLRGGRGAGCNRTSSLRQGSPPFECVRRGVDG